MTRILYVVIASLSLSLFVRSTAAADLPALGDEVVSLVEKIITSSGGKTAVAGMTGVHASGDIEAYMRGDKGRYELFFQRPGKLRVETQYQRTSETRILNNGRGYRGTDNAPLSPVQDHRFLAMVYQYRHFDLAYGLLTGMFSVRMKGKEHLNGKPVYIMHLTADDGTPMDVYIDTETFLIVKVTGYFTVADGRQTTLSSEFSDFRQVGDMVFPFTVMNYAGGQKIAETRMKTCRINPPLEDFLFLP
jgi:hypothetical protein